MCWDSLKICYCRFLLISYIMYKACPESKDTSSVGREGNLLCLLGQHCRWPWSFTCEACSFDSGRTDFVWVRRVWNGSADPKSREMRSSALFLTRYAQEGVEFLNSIVTGDETWGFSPHSWIQTRVTLSHDDDEVQEEFMTWFKGQAADFYDSGIQKLVPRRNKCLDNAGDHVEK